MKINRKIITCISLCFLFLLFLGTTPCAATDSEEKELPFEYNDFLSTLPDYVTEYMPDRVFESDRESLISAADELSDPISVISCLLDGFGSQITHVSPTLSILLGILIISALSYSLSSNLSAGLGKATSMLTRLCSYTALCAVSLNTLDVLRQYFDSLFAAVAAFIPLEATLYAMGGNFTSAVSESATLGIILTVCQFVCTKTTIPLFCLCLSLSLLSLFEEGGGIGASLSGGIKKWYLTAISFIMLLLTTSLGAQNILASRADGVAMKGAKLAISSFVPISGGTLSGTLGTLSTGIELLRSSIGVIGVAVVLLLLLPTIIYLSLLRLCFSFCANLSGHLSCTGEQKLFSELNSLYGYLVGISSLCAVIFIFALAIFIRTATPF